ncbi:MAG: M48 family peptidase, partial [Methyloceanibacter sp.]
MLRRLRPGNGETIEVKVKGLGLPLLLRRSSRARRFSLQVSEPRRGAILTMPVYSSFADADEFLSRHLDWLKERVAGLSEPVPFTHGAIVPLRGFAHLIRFAGTVRQRGVVWLEEADDMKVAPAWPQGARLPIRRLPRLVVAGEPDHA